MIEIMKKNLEAFFMKISADGKSFLEIRQTIDEQYKTGYANPTPMPES
jgi:hypothetical protein